MLHSIGRFKERVASNVLFLGTWRLATWLKIGSSGKENSRSNLPTIVRGTTLRVACGVSQTIRVRPPNTPLIYFLIVWAWQLARAWPLVDEDHKAGSIFDEFAHIMLDNPHLRGRFAGAGFESVFHPRLAQVAILFESMMQYLLNVPWTPLEDGTSKGELPVYHAHIYVRLLLLSFFRDPEAQSCLDLKLRKSKPRPCLTLRNYRKTSTTLATMNETGARGTGSVPAPVPAGNSTDDKQLQRQTNSRQVSPSPVSGPTSHRYPTHSRQVKLAAKRAESGGTSSQPATAASGSQKSNVRVSSRGTKRQRQSIAQDDLDGDAAASVLGGRPRKKAEACY